MLILRRNLLLSLVALTLFSLAPEMAFADQGSGGGSSGNSENSGSGSSGSGSSGSGSSGSDDGDDNNHGSGGENDNEGDGKEIGHDEVRDAVESGGAMSLRKAMIRAKEQTDGRIIDVSLVRKSSKFVYVFTVVEPSGRIEKLRMDAVSGRFAGLLGF